MATPSKTETTLSAQFGKHLQLSKTRQTTLVVASIAIFAAVLGIVSAKALIGQAAYRSRVIAQQETALSQLSENEKMSNQLMSSYQTFVQSNQNAIGGSSFGTGPRDGNNAQIVMDALPSSYDFPQLTSSLEKLILNEGMSIKGISGQDDQIEQQANTSSSSPSPIEIPFTVSASGNYDQVKNLVYDFENSIRPFQIQSIELKGDQSQMTVNITAQTYFQPAKVFNIEKEVVK
jgi:Tfp pilus assembly protein PilO